MRSDESRLSSLNGLSRVPELSNEAFAAIVIVTQGTEARERVKARLEKAVVAPEVVARVKAGTPAGFIAEPADVAGLVAYLVSPEAAYVTGQTILTDGGRWMV